MHQNTGLGNEANDMNPLATIWMILALVSVIAAAVVAVRELAYQNRSK